MANNETQDEGFDCRFALGKSYGSHQFLNWWQQLSPGQLHLDGFESQSMANKKRHPNGWRSTYKDEGFDYQKGCHQFLNWWQRYATGISHLDGFESLISAIKNPQSRKRSGIFWQRMRDSNPRKRSQSPVCYRYTNPLFGTALLYARF